MLRFILGCVLFGIIYSLGASTQQQEDQQECPLKKYCVLSSPEIACRDFERFDQLRFNYSNCAQVFPFFTSIDLHARSYQLLDLNTFDLFHFINFTFDPGLVLIETFSINHLTGFVLTDVYTSIDVVIEKFYFIWLEFVFFTRQDRTSSPVELSLDCSGYRLFSIQQKRQLQLFWNTFNNLFLSNVAFPPRTCPLVFDNVNMSTFGVSFPQYGRHLEFEQDNQTKLNANIQELVINGWHLLTLDKRLINPQIFAKTNTIRIEGTSIKSIELDLFKDLSNLKLFYLYINNMKAFYHSKEGGTKWMEYLNYYQKPFDFANKTTLNISELSYIQDNGLVLNDHKMIGYSGKYGIGGSNYYFYSDEDFCLFVKFPLERLVTLLFTFDLLGTYLRINCSCTIIWLYQYYFLYQLNNINQPPNPYIDCLNSRTEFENSLVECDFNKKKALCDINSTISYSDDIYAISYYLDQAIKQVKMVVLSQVQSVVSFVGVLSNALAILTILYNWRRRAELMNKQKNKSEEVYLLKEPLYKQMLYSSVANSLYCLLFFLNSVIPCDYMDDIQATACFRKDLSISIVLSFLKLISNFCLLQMSVHRYLLVGKVHNKILERLGNIKTKIFVIFVLVVSGGLSSITYFEQVSWTPLSKIKDGFIQEFSYMTTVIEYYHAVFDYSSGGLQIYAFEYLKRLDQVTLIFCLVILSDLFSYFLYCLFSLILDLITIKKLKEAIKDKEKTGGASFNKEKFTLIERKGITMVVLSSLFNFFLRMPELASIIVLYYLVIQGNMSIFYTCLYQNDCISLVSISDVFYMLSISTNLVFYVKFNSNFNASFMKLVKRASCRKDKSDVNN